jgi:hypothetical protein
MKNSLPGQQILEFTLNMSMDICHWYWGERCAARFGSMANIVVSINPEPYRTTGSAREAI